MNTKLVGKWNLAINTRYIENLIVEANIRPFHSTFSLLHIVRGSRRELSPGVSYFLTMCISKYLIYLLCSALLPFSFLCVLQDFTTELYQISTRHSLPSYYQFQVFYSLAPKMLMNEWVKVLWACAYYEKPFATHSSYASLNVFCSSEWW